MMDLTNRVVLITGAKGGLGSAVTQAFLDAGAVVVGTSRTISASDFAHKRFHAMPEDLADGGAVARLAGAVAERFAKIDSLIHVAGGFAGGTPIHETDDATWDGMMNLNAGAAFHVLRAVIPHMRRAGRGSIVAIGSRACVEPVANLAAYNASKAALLSLVRTAALENRDARITANVILPGTIDTASNRASDPAGNHAQWIAPERLAALALFLASDAGAQIPGAAIPVYGFQ